MNRRGFITGLIGLVAAPAVVRFENIMPVRGLIVPIYQDRFIILDEYSECILAPMINAIAQMVAANVMNDTEARLHFGIAA